MNETFESIEAATAIEAPARVVFEKWTRFEEFPRFMEGVKEVRRIDGRKLAWRGEFAGDKCEWTSEITVWIPGRRIAWRATSAGAHSSRVVRVEDLGNGRSRVTLKMLVDPEEAWTHFHSAEELQRRLEGDLERFKSLVG